MRLLDLFCGAGGAAKGYADAGFTDIVGVDLDPQPNYPYKFIQMDAFSFLNEYDISAFDLVHASPPCQKYSFGASIYRLRGYEYDDFLEGTIDVLDALNVDYVVENVPHSPMESTLKLCGCMFDLNVIRLRLFKTTFDVHQPEHKEHKPPIMRPSRRNPDKLIKVSQYCSVAGHGGHGNSHKLSDWQEAMGIDWMTRTELTQAIPPAYTAYIGSYYRCYHQHK